MTDLPLVRGCHYCGASVRVDADAFCPTCGLAIVPKSEIKMKMEDGKLVIRGRFNPKIPEGKK